MKIGDIVIPKDEVSQKAGDCGKIVSILDRDDYDYMVEFIVYGVSEETDGRVQLPYKEEELELA